MNSEVMTVLIAFITAVIGYYLGAWKSFTDQKLKTYVESLPVLSKVAFSPDNENTKEINKIIMELWLYGSKKVVKKMDTLISYMIDPRRGNRIVALQELTVAMRKDIQRSPFQKRMSPTDIKHLFVRLNRQ